MRIVAPPKRHRELAAAREAVEAAQAESARLWAELLGSRCLRRSDAEIAARECRTGYACAIGACIRAEREAATEHLRYVAPLEREWLGESPARRVLGRLGN